MQRKQTLTILLAFDFGTKRIGVAVGQLITQTATPLATLKAKNGIPDWHEVNKLINKWRPNALIVGIPLNMDGTEQKITEHARNFAKQLAHETGLPIFETDERLTSTAAREKLFAAGGYKALQDGQVDSAAAQLILQNWFAEHPKHNE